MQTANILQEKSLRVANLVDRLKIYFHVKTAREVGEKLGVKESTISSWKNRGSVDWELIFAHCKDMNWNWFIKGEGEPSLSNDAYTERLEDIVTRFSKEIITLNPALIETKEEPKFNDTMQRVNNRPGSLEQQIQKDKEEKTNRT